MVRGNVIGDFARITLQWPNDPNPENQNAGKADFTATTQGNQLIVQFDREANPYLGGTLRSLYPYITKSEVSGDRKTIIFTMQKPYAIRSFSAGNETGVEILGIRETAEETPAKPADQPPTQEAPTPAIATAEAPTRITPLKPGESASPAKDAPARITPEPAIAVAAPPATPQPAATAPVSIVPSPAPVASVAPASITPPVPTAPPHAVSTTGTPGNAPETVVPSPAVKHTPTAPLRQLEKPVINGDELIVEVGRINALPTLRFPWEERVAAALWQPHSNEIWVLFSKPARLTRLLEAVNGSATWLTEAEQLGGKDYTLLRLLTRKPVHMVAQKEAQGYAWLFSASVDETAPAEALLPDVQAKLSAPFVFVPIRETEGPFTIRHPETGLRQEVVAVYAGDTGIAAPRDFVDFSLPQTAQGLVVSPHADKVETTREETGIRIHSARNNPLAISKALPVPPPPAAQPTAEEKNALIYKPTLFPYREWQVRDDMDFRQMQNYLLHEITTTPDAVQRSKARRKLAELYLGENLLPEALSVLRQIRATDLDYFRREKLAALEGVTYLLRYRLPEAALSLSSDTLDDTEEGALLRKAVAAAMDSNAEEIPFMEYYPTYIRQYPPALQQRLAIIAADHAIQKKDLNTPIAILETLEKDDSLKGAEDYAKFLRAQVAAETGNREKAETLWTELAQKIDDRQFRARAEYALVLMLLKQGDITPQAAIERLEKLRIVWRGDDLERSLLILLGQLYVNHGDHWKGMKAWEELMQFYPNTPDAVTAYQKLVDTFRNLFLDNGSRNMRPLSALALYNEFQELTPLGDDGNKMIQNLVDRLVAVDLLDQAAARLEHQIRFRLQGEEKSRIGARLALIHLLNREPERALAAIQESRVDDVPAALSLQRNRLAAQSLVDLNRANQALTMIEGDYSPEGEAVRLSAYLAKEDWANVIDLIELNFRAREDMQAPFNDKEARQLLQLTLAYLFLGEYGQLNYLRESYAPLMENSPYKQEFLFMTQERVPVNHEDFKKVAETIANIKGFMDDFREKLKTKDLSSAIE